MRPVTLLKSIALSAALSSVGMVPGAMAATTTVVWSGGDNFNDAQITFNQFKANELTDITGFGQYEACCTVPAVTSFNLDLRLNGHWTTIFSWTTTGDEIQHKLADLVPPVINSRLIRSMYLGSSSRRVRMASRGMITTSRILTSSPISLVISTMTYTSLSTKAARTSRDAATTNATFTT
jgi:hypothetical protein